MFPSTYCDNCGYLMKDDAIYRVDFKDCTQHYCTKCGNCYESGFRYNTLTKQYIKYVRFNL